MKARSRVVASAVAATVALAVGAVVVVRSRGADEPRDPTFAFTQDAKGVHIQFHNPNSRWGLRDQPVAIFLRTADGQTIRSFGPDFNHTIDDKSNEKFHCCTIPLLPPEGDYTLTVLPVRYHVDNIDIKMRGGPQWVRM